MIGSTRSACQGRCLPSSWDWRNQLPIHTVAFTYHTPIFEGAGLAYASPWDAVLVKPIKNRIVVNAEI